MMIIINFKLYFVVIILLTFLHYRLEVNLELPNSEAGAIGSASAATNASAEQVRYTLSSYRLQPIHHGESITRVYNKIIL